MPRKAREKSIYGIYHVMFRGVNHQQIFYDDWDCVKFVELLQKYKEPCGYKIFAYCLMGNHIHILIQEGDVPLEIVFKRIGASYVQWYNKKYTRCGHLFQDRYKSEPVNTQSYFLTVLRYILRNPVKANICKSPCDHKHSNAREILYNMPSFTDTSELYSYFPLDVLRDFIMQENNDDCLELAKSQPVGVTDEKAINLIMEQFNTLRPNPGIKKSKERMEFNTKIQYLNSEGISIHQLSRLIGVSRKLIRDAL